jgi:hypothetical protein
MTLTHFVIFVCIVYIAIVLGRMSAKNDMRRRFASIDEGQNFSDVESVINYILNLRDQVETLLTDKKALTNSLNIAIAGREKLERDYKALMVKMKVKREECEMVDAANKKLVAKINKCADKFDKWMQKLWEFVSDINDNGCELGTKIAEYCESKSSANKKFIYVTGLVNKTYLLSIGQVEVLKNGSLKYSESSRSLGNYASKDNRSWLNGLKPLAELSLIKPRESKPIAFIADYYDYHLQAKKFKEVSDRSFTVISESAKMLDYMREIKDQFPNILYNK